MSRRRKAEHPFDFGSSSKRSCRPTQHSQNSRQRFHGGNNEYKYRPNYAQQGPYYNPYEDSYPNYQNSQQTFHDDQYPNDNNQFPENLSLDLQQGLHEVNYGSQESHYNPYEHLYPNYQNSQQTFHDDQYPNDHNQFSENLSLDVQQGLHEVNYGSQESHYNPYEHSYPNYQNSQQTFHGVQYPNDHNQYSENLNLNVQQRLYYVNSGSQERNTVNRQKVGNVSKVSSKCHCGSKDTPQQKGVDNNGMRYQYSAVIFVAINLSEKSAEEEYVLFCNPICIEYIDDLVLKVKRNGKYHLYFFQMKHKEPGTDKECEGSKIEKELQPNKKKKISNEFKKYREEFARIIKKTAEEADECFIFKNVDTENMHFFFYSNRSLNDLGSPINIGGRDFNIEQDSDIEQQENYGAILPKELFKKCYKLVPRAEIVNDEATSKFLEKTRLFLNQPHVNDIGDNIIKLYNNELANNMVEELVSDVHRYFKINETSILTREAFETELLKIRLSDNIDKISHEKLTEMNTEQVRKWNEVTSSYDIVLVDDVNGIKPILFGCVLQKIRDFLMADVTQQRIPTKDIINKLMQRVKQDGKILWIDKTDSLDVILIELWRHYNIPLILNKDIDIAILNKYRHLKKKFIVRCDGDVEKANAVKQVPNMKVFTSVADIKDQNKRSEFLKIMQASLQGRKPVSLESIIGTDEPCMNNVGSAEILRFINKKSDIYLDEKSFEIIKNMVIIKEISKFKEERQEYLEVKYSANKNLVINCHSSNVESKKKEIKDNAEYGKYSVYHLKQCGEKLLFESGKKSNVKDFLVDEDGNHVFTSDASEEYVSIIGTYLEKYQHPYVARKFHIPILSPLIFDSKPRVYFIFGELESLDHEIRKKIKEKIKKSAPSEEFLQKKPKIINSSLVYNVTDFSRISDIVTNEDFQKTCPVVFINVSNGKLVLLNYKNCDDLDSYISYSEDTVSEKVFSDSNSEKFFKNNPITVITGDAGMGKTALLHSLSQACNEESIVLFCDLTDYRKNFEESKKINIKLNFVESRFKNLLGAIYNYQVKSGKIILLLDSFDEMWPIAKEKLLDFIKDVSKMNIIIIIASRTIVANVIINTIPVNPYKLVNLTIEDLQNCYGYPLDDAEISKMPKEILVNPLYFNFLMRLKDELPDLTDIDVITLYKNVISMMIDEYKRKVSDIEVPSLLKKHQVMALAIIFNKHFLTEQGIIKDYESFVDGLKLQKIKLGIIRKISDNGSPVFIHQSVAEYLAAQWLSENLFKEDFTNAPSIYRKMVEDCDKNVQYLFDSIICNELPLHKAIIKGDLDSVENLLSEDNNIEKVDECGRNPSHLAACYCIEEEGYVILELIVKHMIVNRKCAIHCSDAFLNWTWLDYIKIKNPMYRVKAFYFNSIAALKMYFTHWNDRSFWGVLDTVVMLYRMRTYFDIFAIQETIDCGCLDIVCKLFEFYSEAKMDLGIFVRLSEHLYDIRELKYINARIYWSGDGIYEFTPLHVASLYGHSQTVEKLIKLGADVNDTDNYGWTPLLYAIIGGSNVNSKIFKLLFYHTVNKNEVVNGRNGDHGYSLFTIAVESGKLDIVKFLLSNGADVTQTIYNGDNALHLACRRGHASITWYLATKYPDLITMTNKSWKSPYSYASDEAKSILTEIEMTQRSVDSAEVQLQSLYEALVGDEEISTDMVDETPLPSAPTNNNEKLIEFPLKEDISLYDINELFLSGVKTENMTFLNDLLEKGLNVEDIKEPILHAAIEIGNMEIIEFLLVQKIKINIVDKFNRSAMHIAAREGNVKIAELLLQYKIDLNIVTKFNESALHIAFKYENLEIVELLVNRGIDVNIVSRSKESALHYAVKMNYVHIVNLLVQKGANVYVKEGNDTAVTALLQRGIDDNADIDIMKQLLDSLPDNEFIHSGIFLSLEESTNNEIKTLFIEYLRNTANQSSHDAAFRASICNENYEFFQFLISLKVINLNFVNENGSYLHYAIRRGQEDYSYSSYRGANIKRLKYLIPKYKDVINDQDVVRDSALHMAVNNKVSKAVKWLIKAGININLKDNYGNTALDDAYCIKNPKLIHLLEMATNKQSDGDVDNTTNTTESESSSDSDDDSVYCCDEIYTDDDTDYSNSS